MNITVRQRREDDAEELERLGMLATSELSTERGGRRFLAEHTGDHSDVVIVGTIDGVVVGFGAAETHNTPRGATTAADDDPVGTVVGIYVEPPARGVGVGAALMTALLDWFGQRGCSGVDAIALPGMRGTKNFFEMWGFTARALVVHRSLARPGVGGGDPA